MSEQKTHAEIVAEMRHGFDKSWHDIDREWVHELADRLEAAHKREMVEASVRAATDAINLTEESWRRECRNATKIRNALKEICDYAACCVEVRGFDNLHMSELAAQGRNALAAPARNCDVYAPEVLHNIFMNELPQELEKGITERERDLIELTAKGVIDTLFATYDTEEGGNKK